MIDIRQEVKTSYGGKVWEKSDFLILKRVGRGKFGEVTVARQKDSDYVVALKTMGRFELNENKYNDQVKRQIAIQSSLDHPNVLKLFGYFWDCSSISLILEYAPRGQLYQLLQRSGPLPEPLISRILEQLCQGVCYLHTNGIIHRDIKPQNILVSLHSIKIADFGWAVATQSRRNTFCGTLDYLSPEMLKGNLHDAKVDIWAIGVLAFELVTGKTPFEQQTSSQTLSKIVENRVPMPSSISRELKRFIERCLQKDPKHRPSASALLMDSFLRKHAGQPLQFPTDYQL